MKFTHPREHILQRRWLWTTHLVCFTALLLWFAPLTHPICQRLDAFTFYLLNGSLVDHPLWQQFWGILNHRREVSLNLVMAALFNLWAILATRDKALRKTRIKQILYFWICFQIGFTLQYHFFNTFLEVARDSPSLTLHPVTKLSVILQNTNIKDASYHSFPSGHAFSMVYWAAFTTFCAPRRIAWVGVTLAFILCLARLFSGAHWLSDTLFSGLLALIWLSWTISTPIYRAIINHRNLLPNT